MKYAFIRKKFHGLGKEVQTIFLSQVFAVLVLFFPWISQPSFAHNWQLRSALQGETWLIGIILLLLSLSVVFSISSQVINKKPFQLPWNENMVYLHIAIYQIILVIIAWSVLLVVQRSYEDAQIRFGLALAFVAYLIDFFVCLFMLEKDKKDTAHSFFQNDNQNDK